MEIATAEKYREQGRRIRQLAKQSTVPSIKKQLDGIATHYDELADAAERRVKQGGG